MMDLGTVPSVTGSVQAQAISGDGKVVVGQASVNSKFQPFRWSTDQGLQLLGPYNFDSTYLYGSSSDGRFFAGTAKLLAGSSVTGAYKFDANGNGTLLSGLGGDSQAAYGISNDGTVIVGNSDTTTAGVRHAVRWTAGVIQDLGVLATGDNSSASGVSGDGKVVVGSSGLKAFRWDATNKMVDLGTLGGTLASAAATNQDGSVVVGTSATSGLGIGQHAFRWTSVDGMQDLGTLGGDESSGIDVNADGSVVVGSSNLTDGALRAFRWTDTTGMTNLGVLSGETSSVAYSVSDDGNTIVGTSGNRAFIWTPDALQDLANLQLSDITSANTLAQLTATQTRRIRELSSQQCIPGSAQQYCLSAGVGAYTGEAGTSGKQGITQASGGMRLNEQFSIGGNLNLASADLHSESAKQDSALGVSVWAAYQQHPDNLGWQGSASVAVGTSDNSFERGAALSDVQRARANSRMNSTALRVAAGYGMKVDTTLLTPEIALSHARSESDGYTERNVAFPLTLNGASSNDTYATFGVRSQTPLSPKATLHLGVALDALLNDSTDAIRGHSQVPGLSDFTLNSSLDKRRLVPVANVGYSYALDANSSVAAQVQAGTSVYEAQGAVFGVGVQYRYAF